MKIKIRVGEKNRLVQLAKQDVEYNGLEAIEVTMVKLKEELKN